MGEESERGEGTARSRDILVYNGGYGALPARPPLPRACVHAKEISFTFYDELVIMPYRTALEK